MKSGDLVKAITSIASGIRDDNISEHRAFLESEDGQKAIAMAVGGELEEFYYSVIYPQDNLVDAVLDVSGATGAMGFLFSEYSFVKSHLSRLFSTYEGSACSVDKCRTVMSRLVRHYQTGEEIVFDYTGEYTFHLPKKVLTTHTEIIEFLVALWHLHCGSPEKYISQIEFIKSKTGGAVES